MWCFPTYTAEKKGRFRGLFFWLIFLSFLIEEALESLRARGVPQLPQRLGLDLAYALARDVELLADFLERVVGGHLDAEAHAQHFRLSRR